MKTKIRRLSTLGLAVVTMFASLAAPLALPAQDNVLVSDPYALPPTDGAGWYSAPGQVVSFYVEYGTNLSLGSAFTGTLVRAESVIVDDFRDVTNWYDGNDQVIRFAANLTASLSQFGGLTLSPPWLVTIGGHMQVRLTDRLGRPTGVFPLTVDAMSFTLFMSDIGLSGTNAYLNIRARSAPPSAGQIAVTAAGGQYQVASVLNVHSEASLIDNANGWRPYWPDTNAPTRYDLRPLQPPALALVCTNDGPGPAIALRLQTRRNVHCVLDRSTNLRAWTPFQTNYSTGCGLGEACDVSEPRTNPAAFYRTRTTWMPRP